MRILYLSPDYRKRVNWGHQLMRDALARVEDVDYLQYGQHCEFSGKTHIPDILEDLWEKKSFTPDVIVLENWKNVKHLTGISECKNILKVLYLGDYLSDNRGNINQYNRLVREHNIQAVFCPVQQVVREFEASKKRGEVPQDVAAHLLPYTVDIDIFKPRRMKKIYDVMAVFGLVSYVYPMRPNVQAMIKKMPVSSLIGDWKSGIRHLEYAKAINKSKIFVSVNGINNQITMKYTEAMASGALLLTNKPKDFASLGYIPGKHCVCWSSLHDLRERILYYLDHEDEMKSIAKAGMEFVRTNYNTDVGAEEFATLLAMELGEFSREKEEYDSSEENGIS
jgi:hypothetical protein